MDIIEYIEFGLLYMTLAIFLFRYNQLSPPFSWLIFYIINLTICNTWAYYLYRFKAENNLFLFHFFVPIEYLTLCLLFYASMESRLTKKVILISMSGFVIVSILLSLYVNKLNENNSIARVAEALLVTIWILLYFRQLSKTDKILNVKRDPLFWVYAGLMLYFWGTFFLQILLNYLIKQDRSLAEELYFLQYIFEYTSLITINVALFCHRIFKRTEAGGIT